MPEDHDGRRAQAAVVDGTSILAGPTLPRDIPATCYYDSTFSVPAPISNRPSGRRPFNRCMLPAMAEPTRSVSYHGQTLHFHAVSPSTHWRVDHFFDAEPDTLQWLARMRPDEVLFDVGANVGTYSITAAKAHGARVLAFEPEALNYASLNRNIAFNGCENAVTAYCLAIAEGLKIDRFYLFGHGEGHAMHAFGAPRHAAEGNGSDLAQFPPCFVQGAVSLSIDALIANGLPSPRYLKVDVDGIEPLVIKGARHLIETADQLSILVEANPSIGDHKTMLEWIESAGLRCADRRGPNFIFDRP
jgi:FkbM family methyltransferase